MPINNPDRKIQNAKWAKENPEKRKAQKKQKKLQKMMSNERIKSGNVFFM